MNLALFDPEEISRPLPRSDRRARHILTILHGRPGTTFDVGLVDGPRGRATIRAIEGGSLRLDFRWGPPPPPPDPITLVIGLPRPQTARDLLREAASLGVAMMHFTVCERTESGYAQSRLWRDGEWRRHLIAGAEQAFTTRLPIVTAGRPLPEVLAALPSDTARIALDNYEAAGPFAGQPATAPAAPLVLAFGPERGWTAGERTALQARGFRLAHLGRRVLRLETAVIAALTLAKAARGTL